MANRANDNPPDPAQMSLGGIVTNLPAVRAPKKINTLSRVHRRLIEPVETDEENELAFQHTVFCQTSLPYRNPGDELRLWKRQQGAVSLLVEAGHARNPKNGDWVQLGLPGEPNRA